MKFDLVIIGGGLVGAGLALALRASHLQVALVEARLPQNNDPRLFALNHSSCQFLSNLNIWSQLAAHACAINEVHVSNQGHFGALRLKKDEVRLPALGYVIPAYLIESALHEALTNDPVNITRFQPATLKTLQLHDDRDAELIIETQQGEMTLTTPLVIGADGTQSTLREQLGITTEIFDYEQSAIVTQTTLQRPHQHIAYERFNPNGAIAMLPLTNQRCATIWTAKQQVIEQLQNLSDEAFLQTLQNTFGYRLGRFKQIHTRHVFPLRMVKATQSSHPNVYLLGNAAHTMHPIAAQGFNLALYEVAALAESIIKHNLSDFNARIQKQLTTSIKFSHGLAQLFTDESLFPNLALQLGMIGLDITIPLKKRVIEKILGRTGRMPRLLMDTNSL